MATTLRSASARSLVALTVLPLLIGACAVGSPDENGAVGHVSSATITPRGPYGVSASPSSFDFGLLRWMDQRHETMTFTAPEAQDLDASFAENYGVWRVDTVTRQNPMVAEDHQTVVGRTPLHVNAGDFVSVDFTLDAQWSGVLDTTLWVRGDKWIAKAPVKATATWTGGAPAVSAWVTMDQDAPYEVGGTGPSFQTRLSIHLVNVGTMPAHTQIVQTSAPGGVSLQPESWLYDSASGETKVLRAGILPYTGATRLASFSEVDFDVVTPNYTWHFSIPIHVIASPPPAPKCGKLGEKIGPDGCCAGTEHNPFNDKCETPDDRNCGGLALAPADRCCRHKQACAPCTGTACSSTNQPVCVHDGPRSDDYYCELRNDVPSKPACSGGVTPTFVVCHVDCDHSGNVSYAWACSIEDEKKTVEDNNDRCEVTCEASTPPRIVTPPPLVPPTRIGKTIF
jgi:hypothetical protein